jgi:hypothetical protein
VTCASPTPVDLHQATRLYIPEDRNVQSLSGYAISRPRYEPGVSIIYLFVVIIRYTRSADMNPHSDS